VDGALLDRSGSSSVTVSIGIDLPAYPDLVPVPGYPDVALVLEPVLVRLDAQSANQI